MANTFKVVTFAAEPASAGTAYKMYTVAGSTTTVVLGLILTNIHTTAVTAEVELVKGAAVGFLPINILRYLHYRQCARNFVSYRTIYFNFICSF